LRAARHAELDPMSGVSSNIMCGQEGYFGTGAFQVLLNIDEMNKLGSKSISNKINIAKMLNINDPNDKCSLQNISINNSTQYVGSKNTGLVDDEYDPGF